MIDESCPFCGSKDNIVITRISYRFVRCNNCKACGPEISRYKDGKARQKTSTSLESQQAWDKRVEVVIKKYIKAEPEYLKLLKMKPGIELDNIVNEIVFKREFYLFEIGYSTDIKAAFEVVKKMGYITLSTDEGIHWVSCSFVEGDGVGREIQGNFTIPEVICKAAIAAKMFPKENKEEQIICKNCPPDWINKCNEDSMCAKTGMEMPLSK